MDTHHLDYAWEQLYGATSSLACSTSPLRERLIDAVSSRVHRVFSRGSKDELPPNIAEKLNRFEVKLTKHGSFRETVEKMEDSEVKDAIEEIVSLFNMVARALPED